LNGSVSFSFRTRVTSNRVTRDWTHIWDGVHANSIQWEWWQLIRSAETLKKVGNWTLEHPTLLRAFHNRKPSFETHCLVKASRNTH